MKKLYFLFSASIISLSLFSQDTASNTKIKKGWNFGLLPAISYNSDLGFQYGILTNVFNYGDGSIFPQYKHSIYTEISRYTKGSGIFRLAYDSKYFIPKIRFTGDLIYLQEQALDFFGFNGYDAVYNTDFIDSKSPEYQTRTFYKHARNFARLKLDFRSSTGIKNIDWLLGYRLIHTDVGSVPIDKLNKGKSEENKIPDAKGLYDLYVDWDIISPEEIKACISNGIKTGIIYDTRDNEANPMKGIWTEIVLLNSFSKYFNFGKLAITHRQYFTIIPDNFSFVYRLGYQGIVYGKAPFYMLPYMVYSYMPSYVIDGLGGNKSVRGIIRNRVVADGVAYANFEFRYKFWHFSFINQNWYAAISPFIDAGTTVQKTKIDFSGIPDDIDQSLYFKANSENIHLTYGCGLHIAMNQNFVIAADLGLPVKKDDGKIGIYIGMNWMF